MPVQHTFQPLPDLRYRLVHTTAQRLLDLLQLRFQSLPRRLSSDLAMALSGGSTTMRKPQKRETLRLPFPPSPRAPRSRAAFGPNSINRVFSGCSSRRELCQPFPKFLEEPF